MENEYTQFEPLGLTDVKPTESTITSNKIPTYNPFLDLVKKYNEPTVNPINEKIDTSKYINPVDNKLSPITVSTKNAQDYINKGFKLSDIDLRQGDIENDLSSTQSSAERFGNNLANAGANFVSMAVTQAFSNPLDLSLTADLGESTIAKALFDWSGNVQKEHYNFQTKADESDDIWTNITNWIPGSNLLGVNSTKGFGKLLESSAFGLGAAAGIAAQELAVSALTGGTGTIPLLTSKIQKLLNSGKYLDRALEVSRIAELGAKNLSTVIKVGDITENTARALKGIYRSQIGGHSEALFEGLEGKESLKKQLTQEEWDNKLKFSPLKLRGKE